jgi:hypothetical protein
MRMKSPNLHRQHASTLVVTISVVATILTLLGVAVGYTQHLSRASLHEGTADDKLLFYR